LINTVFALLLLLYPTRVSPKDTFRRVCFEVCGIGFLQEGPAGFGKKRVRVEKALGEQNLPSIEFQKK